MIGKLSMWGPTTALGGGAVCAMVLAGWWLVRTPRPSLPEIPPPSESLASPAEQQAPSPLPLAAVPDAGASYGPRVDVTRIMPNGEVVVAGRAQPGARVALLDNGEILLEMQADPATGEFVFLPPRLGAGAHKLSLRSTNSSDGAQMKESAVETFSISPQVKAANAGNIAPSGQGGVRGGVQAEPRASGAVANANEAAVVRGDTLWRISREKLGRGSLYPTIVQANSAKIRDPNLIYPGHTLTIP